MDNTMYDVFLKTVYTMKQYKRRQADIPLGTFIPITAYVEFDISKTLLLYKLAWTSKENVGKQYKRKLEPN